MAESDTLEPGSWVTPIHGDMMGVPMVASAVHGSGPKATVTVFMMAEPAFVFLMWELARRKEVGNG